MIPVTPPLDPERSPANKRRDLVRYGTAGASTVSAALLVFLLNGQTDLRQRISSIQDQTTLVASSVAVLQTAVERIQSNVTTYQSADRVAHEAINARLSENDQRHAVIGRDLIEVQQGARDLTQRVARLERQGSDPIGLRAADPQARLAQLVAAIRTVPRDAPGAWTREQPPRPTTNALAQITGTPVSAQERDLAFSLTPLVEEQPTPATQPESTQ